MSENVTTCRYAIKVIIIDLTISFDSHKKEIKYKNFVVNLFRGDDFEVRARSRCEFDSENGNLKCDTVKV